MVYTFIAEEQANPACEWSVSEMCRVLRPGGSLVLNVAALPALRGNHSILGGEV